MQVNFSGFTEILVGKFLKYLQPRFFENSAILRKFLEFCNPTLSLMWPFNHEFQTTVLS